MRRYDHGQIVGEADPPKTLDEFFQWLTDERALADRIISRERAEDPTTSYLHSRRAALAEVADRLGALRP